LDLALGAGSFLVPGRSLLLADCLRFNQEPFGSLPFFFIAASANIADEYFEA
jgi:hypothetical protein